MFIYRDNRIAKYLVSHFAWFWRAVRAVPWLKKLTNRFFINFIVNSAQPRPYPLSLWGPAEQPGPIADYICWTGLVDRGYTGRHLPPASQTDVDALPDINDLGVLFQRGADMTACPKSSALFGLFAQWFTDSFLRTDPLDPRKNTSNHEIDLCQIYGLNAADTHLIRSGQGGKLESQDIGGQEYPPYLFEDDGQRVKQKYLTLSYIEGGDFRGEVVPQEFNTPRRRAKFFLTGLERGNSTIVYSAINTLFLREHNRLCGEIAICHPDWDNDRLFETARNTNIVQLLNIIIEDYIKHLSPALFKMFVEIGFAERQHWYRSNRICAEFNLLYRWHQLVPTELSIDGARIPHADFRFNNDLLVGQGIEKVITASATQRAGRIMPKNTAAFLVPADLAAIAKSRAWRIRPYCEYRQQFGLSPVISFADLTSDQELAGELSRLYGKDVKKVEFLVGLLAENCSSKQVLGDLMNFMVGADAFSHALTNPLLAKNVYGEACFSKPGMDSIKGTRSFGDLVGRNTGIGGASASFSMRRAPGSFGLPVLGPVLDAIDFFLISGWERFFLRRQTKYNSTVFKVNLFNPTIAMLDDRAITALFASRDLVPDRPSDGFQFQIPPLPLLGNVVPSMFETAAAHDQPKAFYMRLLRTRSTTLVAQFERTADEFIERWLSRKRFSFRDELENFAVTFVFRWILDAHPDPAMVRRLFGGLFLHWAVAVTKYLPWSAYSRSVRDYQRLVDCVSSAPTFNAMLELAGLEGLGDRDLVAKQISYLLGNNSFLGIQSVLKSLIGELSRHPDWCDQLREEIVSVFGHQPRDVDTRRLAKLPKLDRFLREVLRLHPPVFFIFGRATRDRVIESASGVFAIDKGQLVMGVIPLAQRDQKVFDQPQRFDPDRFNAPEAARHLIWPRGQQDSQVAQDDRTCPGKDLAIEIAKLFCIALLPRVSWKLKHPPRWGRRLFVLNVAAPKGALGVKDFSRRAP